MPNPADRLPAPELAVAIAKAAGTAGLGVTISLPPDASGVPRRLCNELADPRRDEPDPSGGATVLASSAVSLAGQKLQVEFARARGTSLSDVLLHSSEQRFRNLLDAAPDAVLIWTRERLVYANPALLKMLGFEHIEGWGQRPDPELLHPDDRALAEQRVRELLATGQPTPPMECRLRMRDGSFVPVEILAMLTEWDGARAVLAIGRDLSERKQLQAQLIQADRLAAVGRLAAGVAHEINNPLAYVLLNLQYLMRELPHAAGDANTLERLHARLGEARHGAERVSGIVAELHTLSRRDEERRGPVDMLRVLKSALKIARPHIDGRAQLIEDYEPTLPALGNAARLERVVVNLLVNAAQALPENTPAQNEIRVTLRPSPPLRVQLEIVDNGPGIDPALIDRVFDPFFTTKSAELGLGLGLPICHSIVTSLGGEIKVDSVPGRGTVFRLLLPAEAGVVSAHQHKAVAAPPVSTRRAKVLVVDDELPLASMLSRVLNDEHDVSIASDARQARDLLLAEEFDVVLCDLLMPLMSGMDLYREIQSSRPGLESRIVFMTGGAFTRRASEFLASIPNPRIGKPFDLHEVRRLVRELAADVSP